MANHSARSLPPNERFWLRTEPAGDCIHWTGATDDYGVGVFAYSGTNSKAPRYAWILEHGDIPAGMIISNTCNNPACVKHEHLQCKWRGNNGR